MTQPSNEAFMDAAFKARSEGECSWVAGFPGNPAEGRWGGRPVVGTLPHVIAPTANNYVCVSTFRRDSDGTWRRRKVNFAAMHAVMIDDIGTKVPESRVALAPSVLVETSPENFQAWYFLDPPERERQRAELLVDRMIAAGLSADAKDPGMRGVTRYGRLPVGVNAKPAYVERLGSPFVQRVALWHPERRFSLDAIAEAYGLDLTPPPRRRLSAPRPSRGADDLAPILEGLGLYIGALGGIDGAHLIVCPWVHEHTGGDETGTVYFSPSEENAWRGGFKCQHGHCMQRGIKNVQHFLRAIGRLQTDSRSAA